MKNRWIFLICLAVFGLVALVSLAGNPHPKEPQLSTSCFVFPEGWELVARDSYAYGNTGPFVTYICHHNQSGQYAQCVPEVVACAED